MYLVPISALKSHLSLNNSNSIYNSVDAKYETTWTRNQTCTVFSQDACIGGIFANLTSLNHLDRIISIDGSRPLTLRPQRSGYDGTIEVSDYSPLAFAQRFIETVLDLGSLVTHPLEFKEGSEYIMSGNTLKETIIELGVKRIWIEAEWNSEGVKEKGGWSMLVNIQQGEILFLYKRGSENLRPIKFRGELKSWEELRVKKSKKEKGEL